jgi:hypothetical protein
VRTGKEIDLRITHGILTSLLISVNRYPLTTIIDNAKQLLGYPGIDKLVDRQKTPTSGIKHNAIAYSQVHYKFFLRHFQALNTTPKTRVSSLCRI